MKKISIKKDDLFPDLLQNHPRPIWIFDHKTLQFLEVNDAAIANYGYTRSEFLNMKITEIRPKDQVPKFLAELRPFRLEGAQITEWQHLTKDRRLIDVEIIASQFYFKGRPAVFIEVHDITQRKESDQTIRKTYLLEERTRIVRALDDVVARAFTNILVQLEAAREVIGNSPAQAVRHIQYAECLARQSLNESRQSLLRVLRTIENGDLPGDTSYSSKRDGLTLREREVLQLLTAGYSNKEIAAALNVTEGTVKIHVNHILRKLGTTARTETAILALKKGMVRI